MPKVGQFERFMPKDREGLSVRKNSRNGFVVVELDFIANPAKRSQKWIEEERLDTFAGKAVYDEIFYKKLHVADQVISADPNLPVYRGWDFGGNQSCVICQLRGSQLVILDELPNKGTNTRAFAPEVEAFCNATYGPGFIYFDIIDPSAMWEGRTATGFSCAEVMREIGLNPKPAQTNDPERRIDAVTKLLMRTVKDRRALLINPHCHMTIKGFEGGYHYPEKQTQAQRLDRPVKNIYSHIHDALQYVALRLKRFDEKVVDEEIEYEREITQYSFTG
jgi:hypothetical protein